MVEKIISYLKGYGGFKGKEIIIGYMPSQTGTLCLKTGEFKPLYKEYVDGGRVKQFICELCMREAYTFDNSRNVKNTAFLEGVISWLEEQNKKRAYPEGADFIKAEAISDIYIISNDVSTAEYAVKLRFLYREF